MNDRKRLVQLCFEDTEKFRQLGEAIVNCLYMRMQMPYKSILQRLRVTGLLNRESEEAENSSTDTKRTKPTTKELFLKYGPGRRV